LIRGFYTAASGLKWQQASLDVAANNVANVNTVGFKPGQMAFVEALNTSLADNGAEGQKLTAGSGVRGLETSKSLAQGTLEPTGRSLDAALIGDGFFAARDRSGLVSYTRAGNFAVSVQDGQNFLVTAAGDRVLDPAGDAIAFEGAPEDLILAVPSAEGEMAEGAVTLGVFTFANPYGLELAGEGKYRPSQASGTAAGSTNGAIRQGCLEASATEMTVEFTRIIQAQRAFQMNAKMVQVADELEQTANTLRG